MNITVNKLLRDFISGVLSFSCIVKWGLGFGVCVCGVRLTSFGVGRCHCHRSHQRVIIAYHPIIGVGVYVCSQFVICIMFGYTDIYHLSSITQTSGIGNEDERTMATYIQLRTETQHMNSWISGVRHTKHV